MRVAELKTWWGCCRVLDWSMSELARRLSKGRSRRPCTPGRAGLTRRLQQSVVEVNFTDPSGALTPTAAQLCSFGNTAACQAASAVPQYTPLNLCLRNPISGNWNSDQSGGCRTPLSTSQGAQLIAATVVTTVATVATLGLGDLILPSMVAAYAEEGWGTLDAMHLALPLPLILAPTVGIAGACVWWGFSAITEGPETSGSRTSGRC